jgi:DNA ligase D-like protein (predicted 3'-phosphoesterase)
VKASAATRISISGEVAAVALREDVRAHAHALGVLGWVKLADDGTLKIHAESDGDALDRLSEWLSALAGVSAVNAAGAKVEGHEQFAIRGIPAGVFVVQEHQATAHHYDFRLQIDGAMRSWAVPKGPSMDPAVKRLAVQVEDHSLAHNEFEGPTGHGGVIIWDRGEYEQGGRVPWPEAIERGHAVFVLHGSKLQGGFALQRTGRGEKPPWLLVKRRDEHAQPGSDVAAERPESVDSGVTLEALLHSSAE